MPSQDPSFEEKDRIVLTVPVSAVVRSMDRSVERLTAQIAPGELPATRPFIGEIRESPAGASFSLLARSALNNPLAREIKGEIKQDGDDMVITYSASYRPSTATIGALVTLGLGIAALMSVTGLVFSLASGSGAASTLLQTFFFAPVALFLGSILIWRIAPHTSWHSEEEILDFLRRAAAGVETPR